MSDTTLPCGWTRVRIGDIATVKGGKRLPAGASYSKVPTNHPYIRVTDFVDGSVRVDELKYIDASVHREISRYVIAHEDVYISIAGTIGVSGRVPKQLEGANLTENAAKLTPSSVIDPDFLWRTFTAPDVRTNVRQSTIATTQPKLGLFRIEALEIPLPPINEQRRIVAKLDALQTRSRRARDALEAVAPLLEKLRHSILAAAFRGDLTRDWRAKHPDVEPATEVLRRIRLDRREERKGADRTKASAKPRTLTGDKSMASYVESEPVTAANLPSLPRGWCWARLGDVSTLINGDRGKNYPHVTEYVPLGLPFINTGHIQRDGTLSVADMHYITREKYDSLAAGKVAVGDLVYCLRGATLGKTAIVQSSEGAIASSLVIIRPDQAGWATYLYHFLISPQGRAEIAKYDNGSAQPNLAAKSVADYFLPVPPSLELAAIEHALVVRLDEVRRISELVRACREELGRLDESIIGKAFRGELVPQDPRDELAETLAPPLVPRGVATL